MKRRRRGVGGEFGGLTNAIGRHGDVLWMFVLLWWLLMFSREKRKKGRERNGSEKN